VNATVFKPSGELIGKFEIASVEEIPEKLPQFLATGVRTPLDSYVEAGGQSWTIIGLNPVNLREGHVARRVAQSQKSRHRNVEVNMREHARRGMVMGLCWCVGGILVTVVTYTMAASSPGGGRFILASGAIIWGAIQFFSNLARVMSK
jgi:hypothetical protein